MSACSKAIVVIVALLILLGIGGMIVGCYTSHWYTATHGDAISKSNIGLWEHCNDLKVVNGGEDSHTCFTREKIFKFSSDDFVFAPSKRRFYNKIKITTKSSILILLFIKYCIVFHFFLTNTITPEKYQFIHKINR